MLKKRAVFDSLRIFLAINILIILSLSASGFEFYGYTYNTTADAVANANVSIYVYNFSGQMMGPPIPVAIYSNLSNATGYFFLNVSTIDPSNQLMYKPVVRYINSNARAEYVGQLLPQFPVFQFMGLSPMKFFMKPGITLNITAINGTGSPVGFSYVVKDTKLGYPADEYFAQGESTLTNRTIYLPRDRNYSVMIFPNMAMPQYAEINTTSTYVEIRFNTTMVAKEVSGYAKYLNASGNLTANFDTLQLIVYNLEPGNMLYSEGKIPYNVSGFFQRNDNYDPTTGFYNLTVPATSSGSKMMVLFVASLGNDRLGWFQNISFSSGSQNLQDYNVTLRNMSGSLGYISVQEVMGGDFNISAKLSRFTFTNNSNDANLTDAQGHIEMDLDYSDIGGPEFTWMTDTSSENLGVFTLPLLIHSIERVNVFSHNFAPRELKVSQNELLSQPVELPLSEFNPGGINPGEIQESDIFFDMVKSNSACDVPYPNRAQCSLFGDEPNATGFNPFSVIMGGGQISFRMFQKSTNITVHYVNVDMFASGPPDAAFDSSSNNSQSASNLEQAWRFGSQGPEIYDSVLVGIPYDSTTVNEDAPFRVKIKSLYDDDWNPVWDVEINGTNHTQISLDLPEYADYDADWFTGKVCIETFNMSTQFCYINKTTNLLWLHIPHFSGVGPEVNSVSAGNVTVLTASSSVTCTANCTVEINVTSGNYTLMETLHNISISNSNSVGNVREFLIYKYASGSFQFNGTNTTNHTNYNLTYYNSSSDIHRYRVIINKSTNVTTSWNFTYVIDNRTSLVLTTSLVCAEDWDCTDWSDEDNSCGTRTCTDNNVCGTTSDKPSESSSCSSESTSSSGGTSGGAVASTSPASTKTSVTMTWGQIAQDQEIIYQPNSLSIPIDEIEFTVGIAKAVVTMTVSSYETKPDSVPELMNTNKYLEITPKWFTSDEISGYAKITFAVDEDWVAQNAKDKDSVYLYRLVGLEWEKLDTDYTDEKGTEYIYEAQSPGFSYFAISAEPKLSQEETAEPAQEQITANTVEEPKEIAQESEEKLQVPQKKSGILGTSLVLFIIVGLASSAGALLYMKQNNSGNFNISQLFNRKKDTAQVVGNQAASSQIKEKQAANEGQLSSLKEYIKDARKEKYREDEIREILLGAGWPKDVIDKELGPAVRPPVFEPNKQSTSKAAQNEAKRPSIYQEEDLQDQKLKEPAAIKRSQAKKKHGKKK